MRLLVISALIFILGYFSLLNPIRDSFIFVFGNLHSQARHPAFYIKEMFVFFNTLSSIRSENVKLVKDNLDLKSKLLTARLYEDENIILKTQLALKASGELDKELLLADVLGNPLDQTGQTIIVNKGFSHGVTEGSNVVLKNNLVGVVTSVSRGRSVVSLVTSPNTRSTVVDIDSPDRLEGVARGDFGISIIMSQILPNELISVNDLIVTSGKDGLFEPNLILGKVVEIQGTESDPIRSAVIKSELDLKRLEKVFIIIL